MKRVVRDVRDDAIAAATRALSVGYDPRRTIVVTGSPRSGTTWLAALLAGIPRSAVLFEPLQLEHVPQAKGAGFRWRTFVAPGTVWPDGEAFMQRVLSGGVLNRWTTRELSRPQRVETWIVKFVRANRMLPWMCERFATRRPVLLMRHPCAVVASQLDREWPTGANIDIEHPFGEGVTRYVASLQQPEERLAAVWALDAAIPLTAPRPWGWSVLWFERLVQEGPGGLAEMFAAWDLEVPRSVEERFGVWSSTTGEASRARSSPANAWRERLSAEQIDMILTVVNRLGVRVYDDGPLPTDEAAIQAPDL